MSDSQPNPIGEPGADPAVPKTITETGAKPDYDLLRLIGRGSYGEVWLARHRTGVYRAVKVVFRESFDHDRPYEREYDGLRKFEPVSRSDDNQVQILHVGRQDDRGRFYYIMELADDQIAGQHIDTQNYTPKTLKSELLQRGRLPTKECLRIGVALAGALENLHRHGLIHRDIKPGNIIFVNDVPKLADIGLVTDRDVSVSYVGTEGYIAPEGPGSAQADIFSLGKVLYEMATGRSRMDFPELPTNIQELPDREMLLELNAVIAKACERNPRKRYASAQTMTRDLARAQRGDPVRRAGVMRRRLTAAAKAATMAGLLGLVALGVFRLGKVPLNGPAGTSPGVAVEPSTARNRPLSSDPALPVASPAPETSKRARQHLTNSLGMVFVPVPVDGRSVWFSIWETRVQDFEAFVKAAAYHDADTSPGATRKYDWRNPGYAQGPTHPVVWMNHDDAKAFCQWLTQDERRVGRLASRQQYRLPADHEWSVAVGINDLEGIDVLKDAQVLTNIYPWGTRWPPPHGAGNLAGAETIGSKIPSEIRPEPPIGNYTDDWVGTAPVGQCLPSQSGLYDLSGNAWEWCGNRVGIYYVLRGGGYWTSQRQALLSATRWIGIPSSRTPSRGFRVVLEPGADSVALPATATAHP